MKYYDPDPWPKYASIRNAHAPEIYKMENILTKLSDEIAKLSLAEDDPINILLREALKEQKYYKGSFPTYNADTDRIILSLLPDSDVIHACSVNKYVESICDNDFWREMYVNKLRMPEEDDDNITISYKQVYMTVLPILENMRRSSTSEYEKQLKQILLLAVHSGLTNLFKKYLPIYIKRLGDDNHASREMTYLLGTVIDFKEYDMLKEILSLGGPDVSTWVYFTIPNMRIDDIILNMLFEYDVLTREELKSILYFAFKHRYDDVIELVMNYMDDEELETFVNDYTMNDLDKEIRTIAAYYIIPRLGTEKVYPLIILLDSQEEISLYKSLDESELLDFLYLDITNKENDKVLNIIRYITQEGLEDDAVSNNVLGLLADNGLGNVIPEVINLLSASFNYDIESLEKLSLEDLRRILLKKEPDANTKGRRRQIIQRIKNLG